VKRLGIGVDQATIDAAALKLGGEQQARGAGADYQDVGLGDHE
jgi:hypothetical protein